MKIFDFNKILWGFLILFAKIAVLDSAVLFIDDFNNPTRYNANNLNSLNQWTDDDGTFAAGNTYDKVTNAYGRSCIKLNWTDGSDYWYSVLNNSGYNTTPYEYIAFKVRGTNSGGNTSFSIVLRDTANVTSGKNTYTNLNYIIRTNWIRVQAKLSTFSGINLSAIKSVTFQNWGTTSGKIFVDDLVLATGIVINNIDSTNLTRGDTDEKYYIGDLIRIWITERSNFTGLKGTIKISNTSGYKTNANLIEAGGGKYYFDWNTSGLNFGYYYVETTLSNDYVYDPDGANDSGVDLTIQLLEPLNPRAMWVWDQDKKILYDWGYEREDLFDFCQSPPGGTVNIGIIYIHITPNELLSAQSYIKSFITEAHNRGLKVYYLSGEPNWGQPNDNGIGTNTVKRIVAYNTNVLPIERFDGVDFDIEVHTYSPPSGNWYDNPGAFGNYLNFLSYATNKFRRLKQIDSNFKFGVDIPYFYDTSPCTTHYQEVIRRVDYISLMDYRDTANLIYSLATNELRYASSIGKKVRIGVETQDLGAAYDNVTFYEEGWEYMENTLRTARSNFTSFSSFEREVIHYYGSYYKLMPLRISVTKNKDIQSYGLLQGETNKTVMAIHISSDNDLTYLIGLKITNKGTATGSDIPVIKVWKDNGNIKNEYDALDTYIGSLYYDNSKKIWTNYRFNQINGTNYLGPVGIDIVLTINIATNAISGRTFQAQISREFVLGSGKATGPSGIVLNSGIQIISAVSTNWQYIRINEVQINAPSINPPSDKEPYWEWLELFNTSANIIDLSGCLIGDTYPTRHYWKIPDGTLIPGYGFKVFYGYQFNSSLDTNNGVEFINNNTSSTEKILFLDRHTNLIDSFNYIGLNVGENDIYCRKVDGFGPFYNNSTNIKYNSVWVTSKTDNPIGTTNYYSTKGKPNAVFKIVCNSPSNKVPVGGSLNFTIKVSNLLDNRIVTNYSGYSYIAYLSINGGGIFPTITTNGFQNGQWTGNIQFTDPGEFTLTASYGSLLGNYSMITVYVPGSPPISVSEIDIKQNPGYSPSYSLYLNSLGGGKKFAVYIVGIDGQPAVKDATTAYIKASLSDPAGINATLWETGTNTGVYTNTVTLSINSDDANNIIKAIQAGEKIYAISAVGSLTDSFTLANTPLGLIDTYEILNRNECYATFHYEDDSAASNFGSASYDTNIFYKTFGEKKGKSLRFDFNILSGQYCWVENDVGGLDVTSFTSISFKVRRGTATGPTNCKVQLMSMNSLDWQKVPIKNYLIEGGNITTNWKTCNVPLSVFTTPYKGKLDNIAFVADTGPSQGSLYIDNLRFLPSKATNLVFMSNNFSKVLIETNTSIGATLYIQLEARIFNSNTIDTTPILLQSTSDSNGVIITLVETDRATGIYRGIGYIGYNTIKSNNTIGAKWGDYIYIRSYDNPNLFDKLKVISSNQRLRIIKISPTNQSKNISLTTKITATFNLPILASTVTNNFVLYNSEDEIINFQTLTVNGSNIIFTPLKPLDPNELHRILITTNIKDSIYMSSIKTNTNSYFKTTSGWETFHYYNNITLDQLISDWLPSNPVEIHTNYYEFFVRDVAFPYDPPAVVSTTNLYVTWNSNTTENPAYLFIGLKKNNNGNSKDVWYDYIALDVTRDFDGATNFIDGTFTNRFKGLRKPEYIIKISHSANQKYWNSISTFKFNGSSWVAGPSVSGTINSPYSNSSFIELRIALTNLKSPFATSDKIPNRIAILSWVNQPGFSVPVDYCPENGKFLTFSPDDNGNDIPDGRRLAPTSIYISKSYSGGTAPGSTLTFAIFYSNKNSDALNFKITDEIQNGLIYVPNSLRIGSANSTYETANIYSDDTSDDLASFELPNKISFVPSNGVAPNTGGYLPAFTSGICYFKAKIDSNLTNNSLISNQAFASGANFSNTNSNKVFIIVKKPKVYISKTADKTLANPGEIITYKITVINTNSITVSNFKIYDSIPKGTSYISGSMKIGSTNSTYSSANPLTDNSSDDEGYFTGSKLIFAVLNGVSPSTGGMLQPNSGCALFFQVKIHTNFSGTVTNISITNKYLNFDGYVRSDGILSLNQSLAAGDIVVTNNIFTDNFEDNNLSEYEQVTNSTTYTPGLSGNYSGRLDRPVPSVITKIINASGYGNLVLNFKYQISGTGPGELMRVYYSSNGLAGPWTQLGIDYTSRNLTSVTLTLPSSANNKPNLGIKWRGETLGNNEYVLIDDVVIKGQKNIELRSFTGFNLVSIPSNGNITAATLFLNCYQVDGQGADIQPIILDNVDYGTNIDASDFNLTPIQSNFTNFNATASGWLKLNVKSQIEYCLNNPKSWYKNGSNKYFQIRIRPTNISSDYGSDKQLIRSADEVNSPYIKVYFITNATTQPDIVTNIVFYSLTNQNWEILYKTNIINVGTPQASLIVQKSISNIKLAGTNISAIPGATITYKIFYSNSGPSSASNVIIYDKINNYINYVSNSSTAPSGWIKEFSTNSNPDQSYNSTDYKTNETVSSLIKYIRWKRNSLAAGNSGIITFKAVIK